MAISRQQLKSIVKECLVEILAEGINVPKKNSSQDQEQVKKSLNQSQVHRRGQNVKYNQALAETIKREANGNSIMASILADTAATTLPTMMNESVNQQPQPVGSYERVVSQNTPEQLFGDETASKWAELAFMETTKKF